MPHCQTFIQALRDRGYRITPQREMIISIIAHSGRHMTAEEIYEEIQKQTQAVNIATVYRVLDLLYAEELACRNDLGGGQIVYATTQHGSHIHLVCRRCGNIMDADENLTTPLEKGLQDNYDFQPDLRHISIFGICSACKGE
jgi:Fur family ferric uptake transcriptional regulator